MFARLCYYKKLFSTLGDPFYNIPRASQFWRAQARVTELKPDAFVFVNFNVGKTSNINISLSTLIYVDLSAYITFGK